MRFTLRVVESADLSEFWLNEEQFGRLTPFAAEKDVGCGAGGRPARDQRYHFVK